MGEIDLILRDKEDTLCLPRSRPAPGTMLDRPAAAVDPAKQQRLIFAAQQYLQQSPYAKADIRFDVVEVTPAGTGWQVHAFPGAFEFYKHWRQRISLRGDHWSWNPAARPMTATVFAVRAPHNGIACQQGLYVRKIIRERVYSMQFFSTRDSQHRVSAQAILRGLAPQGGLFVPESFPARRIWKHWKTFPIRSWPQKVLAGFLTDYNADFLHKLPLPPMALPLAARQVIWPPVEGSMACIPGAVAWPDLRLQGLCPAADAEAAGGGQEEPGPHRNDPHPCGNLRRYRQGCTGWLCRICRASRSSVLSRRAAPARSSACRWPPRKAVTCRSMPCAATLTMPRPA